MKRHIAYNIKFICYSRLDDAAESTSNMYNFTVIKSHTNSDIDYTLFSVININLI